MFHRAVRTGGTLSRCCVTAVLCLSAIGADNVHAAAPAPPVVSLPPVVAPPIVPKADTARVAAARHLIDVMLPPADRDTFYVDMVNAMMRNMIAGIVEGQGLGDLLERYPAMRAVFARFVERQRQLSLTDLREHLADLMTAQTNAYARHFSVDELQQLTTFFAQPIGQKYLKETPAVLADPEMSAWQKNVAARAQQRLPAELKTFIDEITAVKAKESRSHGS